MQTFSSMTCFHGSHGFFYPLAESASEGFSDYRQWSGRSGLGGLVIIGNGQAGVGWGVLVIIGNGQAGVGKGV